MTKTYPATDLSDLFPITAMNELKKAQAESFTNNMITSGNVYNALESIPQYIKPKTLDIAAPKIQTSNNPLNHLSNYIQKNWPVLLFLIVVSGVAGYMIRLKFAKEKKEPK
jgi:hypothetical protein